MFYSSPDRDLPTLLPPLLERPAWSHVLFPPLNQTAEKLCPPSPTDSTCAVDAEPTEPLDLDVPNTICAEWSRMRSASDGDGLGESLLVCSSVNDALDTIKQLETEGELDVLVTGSLYVVGQILAYMRGDAGDFAELRRVNFGNFSANDFSPVVSPVDKSPSR
jgi:hypothetical protein